MIAATREATRVDDWTSVPGSMAAFIRDELGVSSSVGCPIVVEGRLWGALAVHSKQSRPLPPDTESRIAQFTDLVGTASPTRSRAGGRTGSRRSRPRCGESRRSSRATRPGRRSSRGSRARSGICSAWRRSGWSRYDDDRTAVVVASSGPSRRTSFPSGLAFRWTARAPPRACSATGEPVRIDDYGDRERRDRARPSARWAFAASSATPIVGRRPAVGRDRRRDDAGRSAAAGDRGPARPVHRADGHRDRQHRVARGGGAARRRAGRAAAGGDAGRGRGLAERGARRGGRGDGASCSAPTRSCCAATSRTKR